MRIFASLCNRVFRLTLGALAVIALVGAARAETVRVPTIELDYAVSDDPRGALRKAAAWLAEGKAKGDKLKQLNALRLSAKANEQGEERPDLARDAEAGLTLARELGDREAEVEFLTQQAGLMVDGGDHDAAAKAFDATIALAEKYGLRANIARSQAAKAHLYFAQDRAAEALALLVEAHAYFETHHDKLGMIYTFSLMAQVFALDPDEKTALRKSIDYGQRALALIDPRRSRHDISVHYHNLGVDYARAKNWVKAREYFNKSLVLVKELGDRVSMAYLDYRLAELDREEGKLDGVIAALDRAIPVFVDTGNINMQLLTLLSRAKTQGALSRKRDAADALNKARALAEKLEAPWALVRTRETAVQLHSRWGEYEKAFREAEKLRTAEQDFAKANNARMVIEIERRFDSRQKEIENQLLRARQQESDARRLALILGLILALTVLTGAALFFARQAQRNRRFQTLAMKDELTGLPNRRSIMEFARTAVQKHPELSEPVIIALIDIDHFKSINDELGHAQGDAVLIAFANACQRELRANDKLGRFGGEEFLLVMPGSGAEQIPAVFERLRASVQAMQVAGLPPGRTLTFSMGATSKALTTDQTEELIQRADRALYRAKEAGRDRLEIG
ncbi:MAG: GGDEF domain-containing protein [Betaproteobacteria bacterium]|nr:GGDEF domain-containing protein [Betaproteobacteria bacterium]